MSGAEALAVVGVIANIVALLDYSKRCVTRINDFSDRTKGLPRNFRDIEVMLPIIADTLSKIKKSVDAHQLSEGEEQILRPSIIECHSRVKELKEILERIVPKEKAGKAERMWKGFSSIWKDKDVEEIVKALERLMRCMADNYTVSENLARRTTSNLESIGIAEPITPKTYFMVPIRCEDNLQGRQDELTRLDSSLCLTNKHCRAALVGLGGIGKTRVALEFARQYKGSRDVSVFWAHAGSEDRMLESYREIARKVHIPGWQDAQMDILGLVKRWLERQHCGKWLLVIDNANDWGLFYKLGGPRLADALPHSANGSVLMTTRSGKIGITFASRPSFVSLGGLSVVEAIGILAPGLPNDASDDRDFRELAIDLGCIPLALVQAAAYMSLNDVSVSEYLQIYRESDSSRIDLLSVDFEDALRDPENKNPITATLAITFDRMRKQDTDAADLLALMSVFDAQAISESLLNTTFSKVKLKGALGSLCKSSLISRRESDASSEYKDERSYDMHCLVRLTTRNWLQANESLDVWVAKAAKVLYERFPNGDSEHREARLRYLPQAIAVLSNSTLQYESDVSELSSAIFNQDHAGQYSHEGVYWPNRLITLLRNVSISYGTDGSYSTAIQYANRALVVARRTLVDVLGEKEAVVVPSRSQTGQFKFCQHVLRMGTNDSKLNGRKDDLIRSAEPSKHNLGPTLPGFLGRVHWPWTPWEMEEASAEFNFVLSCPTPQLSLNNAKTLIMTLMFEVYHVRLRQEEDCEILKGTSSKPKRRYSCWLKDTTMVNVGGNYLAPATKERKRPRMERMETSKFLTRLHDALEELKPVIKAPANTHGEKQWKYLESKD
ncbi:MAG: hypothetical protein Q9163_003989 [Psora crenata]